MVVVLMSVGLSDVSEPSWKWTVAPLLRIRLIFGLLRYAVAGWERKRLHAAHRGWHHAADGGCQSQQHRVCPHSRHPPVRPARVNLGE